ncbi:MAG TPA: hypothetical protein VNJ08_07815 [Bacteriovoracaceae bacterium]|nr:hypothetical protein [Bacteriovoracaceae bacterium]
MRSLFFALLFPVMVYGHVTVQYPERLIHIEEMVTELEISALEPGLGRMGGIYVQTEWQMKTRRDQIKSWNTINAYLTVKPYQVFNNYLSQASKACEGISNKRLCQAWLKYFSYADAKKNYGLILPGMQQQASRLLWLAHEISIEEALKDFPGLLDDPKVPQEERQYLKGWIKFVHILATSRLPTGEKFVRLLAGQTSPDCSPLGAAHCRVQDQPRAVKMFIKKMIAYGSDHSMVQSISVETSP